MDTWVPLCKLLPGQWAIVQAVNAADTLRRRLMDMGLVPGAPVACVGRSPGGDPAAYEICGAVVAIRHRDAAHIAVRVDAGECHECL